MSFGGSSADGYERIFESAKDSWSKFAEACAFANKGAGKTLLDLGAGPGEPSCHLKQAFPEAEITCTDLEADMVTKAKARGERLGVKLQFQVCSAEDLSPFADASFDVVTANMVLMFPSNRSQMIKEAMRVLKPDGRLILTVWKRFGLLEAQREVLTKKLDIAVPEVTEKDSHPLALRAEGAVEKIVADAGFEVNESRSYEVVFRWGSNDQVIRDNLLFVGRRAMNTVLETDRSAVNEKYVQHMFEHAREQGWCHADGSYAFPGEHQMVIITKSHPATKKRKT